jgi:hypothetical protein
MVIITGMEKQEIELEPAGVGERKTIFEGGFQSPSKIADS